MAGHQYGADAQTFVKRLSTILDLQGVQGSQGLVGWINKTNWTAAQKMALEQTNHVLDTISATMPTETARIFADTLRAPSLLYHLALWEGIPEARQNPQMALTILHSNTDFFLLWQLEQDPAQLEVIPVRVRQAWEYIEKILHPILEILPAAEAVVS